jgi:class 3 adenylate cyclase
MAATRRLAAVLATDVAGYSRLMGADEEGTHERLKAHLQELVSPKIAQHRGRVVKSTGDGLLAEFASVVDAVRCAVEVQRAMARRNAAVPADQRVEFRIGGESSSPVRPVKAPVLGSPVVICINREPSRAPGPRSRHGRPWPCRAAGRLRRPPGRS